MRMKILRQMTPMTSLEGRSKDLLPVLKTVVMSGAGNIEMNIVWCAR